MSSSARLKCVGDIPPKPPLPPPPSPVQMSNPSLFHLSPASPSHPSSLSSSLSPISSPSPSPTPSSVPLSSSSSPTPQSSQDSVSPPRPLKVQAVTITHNPPSSSPSNLTSSSSTCTCTPATSSSSFQVSSPSVPTTNITTIPEKPILIDIQPQAVVIFTSPSRSSPYPSPALSLPNIPSKPPRPSNSPSRARLPPPPASPTPSTKAPPPYVQPVSALPPRTLRKDTAPASPVALPHNNTHLGVSRQPRQLVSSPSSAPSDSPSFSAPVLAPSMSVDLLHFAPPLPRRPNATDPSHSLPSLPPPSHVFSSTSASSLSTASSSSSSVPFRPPRKVAPQVMETRKGNLEATSSNPSYDVQRRNRSNTEAPPKPSLAPPLPPLPTSPHLIALTKVQESHGLDAAHSPIMRGSPTPLAGPTSIKGRVPPQKPNYPLPPLNPPSGSAIGTRSNGKAPPRRNSKGDIRRATIRQIRMSIHAEHLLLMEKEQEQLAKLGEKPDLDIEGQNFILSPRSVTTTSINLQKDKDKGDLSGGSSVGGEAAGLSLNIRECVQADTKSDVTSALHVNKTSDLSRSAEGKEKTKRRRTAIFPTKLLVWKNSAGESLSIGKPTLITSTRIDEPGAGTGAGEGKVVLPAKKIEAKPIFRVVEASGEVYDEDVGGLKPMINASEKVQKKLFEKNISRLKENDPQLLVMSLDGMEMKANTKILFKFVESLRNNSELTVLYMRHQAFSLNDDVEFFSLLAPSLSYDSCGLHKIDLTHSSISMKGLMTFAELVRCNFSIQNIVMNPIFVVDLDGPSAMEEVNSLLDEIEEIVNQNFLLHEIETTGRTGEKIFLRSRRMKEYPRAFGNLAGTKILDCSFNSLREFPIEIFPRICDTLTMLDLSNNKLGEVPSDVSLLERLEVLKINANRIVEVPPTLGRLQSLIVLDLADNRVSHPPIELVGLKNVKTVSLSGNPIKGIPKDILVPGREKEAWAYLLKMSLDINMVKSYRLKLMFVGEENVGKTSLVACLLGRKMKTFNMATDGIDISDWHVRVSSHLDDADKGAGGDRKIEFSCWDFAGQTVYYPTHQFFLSSRAVYIVVFDMKTITLPSSSSRSRTLYWLQVIQARSPGCHIILAGTHLDRVGLNSEMYGGICEIVKEMGRKFPCVKKCIFVSCLNSQGISTLASEIVKVSYKQPFIGEEVPKQFFDLEMKLHKHSASLLDPKGFYQSPPIISWSKFTQICNSVRISSDDVKRACIFLHEIGSLFFMADIDENLITLDPTYLPHLFSSIVSMKNQFVRSGMLLCKDLKHIWVSPEFPESLHSFFISLLESFELIYVLAEDRLLIPSLLSPYSMGQDIKEFEMFSPDASQLQFSRIYHFQCIPYGLLPRMIVRLLNSFEWIAELYFSDFLSLRHGNVSTVLRSDDSQNQLCLFTRGDAPAAPFLEFVEGVDSLISESFGLQVSCTIPCTHCLFLSVSPPHFFNLEECAAAVSEGRVALICPLSSTSVLVSDLAPDISLTEIPDCPVIKWDDVIDPTLAGEGAFAEVFRGTWEGREVAVKRFKELKGDMTKGIDIFKNFRREVSYMSVLRDKHIVSLKGVVLTPCVAVVMEWCDKGSLYEFLHSSKAPLTWLNRICIARDMAKGMRFLHQNNLIHRDLKSPNVLLTSSPSASSDRIFAKITDFGVSCVTLFSSHVKGTAVDNPIWKAPEVLLGKAYSAKVDVYSFGVIMWEVITRTAFFGELSFHHQVERAVIAEKRPSCTLDGVIPNDMKGVMERCWAQDPRVRPEFSEIVILLSDIQIRYLSDPSNEGEREKH